MQIEVEINEEKPQLSKISMQVDKFVKMQILKTICYDAIIGSPRMKMAEKPGIIIIKRIFNTLADEKKGTDCCRKTGVAFILPLKTMK